MGLSFFTTTRGRNTRRGARGPSPRGPPPAASTRARRGRRGTRPLHLGTRRPPFASAAPRASPRPRAQRRGRRRRRARTPTSRRPPPRATRRIPPSGVCRVSAFVSESVCVCLSVLLRPRARRRGEHGRAHARSTAAGAPHEHARQRETPRLVGGRTLRTIRWTRRRTRRLLRGHRAPPRHIGAPPRASRRGTPRALAELLARRRRGASGFVFVRRARIAARFEDAIHPRRSRKRRRVRLERASVVLAARRADGVREVERERGRARSERQPPPLGPPATRAPSRARARSSGAAPLARGDEREPLRGGRARSGAAGSPNDRQRTPREKRRVERERAAVAPKQRVRARRGVASPERLRATKASNARARRRREPKSPTRLLLRRPLDGRPRSPRRLPTRLRPAPRAARPIAAARASARRATPRRRATASGARVHAAVRQNPAAFFAHFAASNERVDDGTALRADDFQARDVAARRAHRRRRAAASLARRRVERARAASAAAGCVQTTARRRDARTTVAGATNAPSEGRTSDASNAHARRRDADSDSDSSKNPLFGANGLLVLAKKLAYSGNAAASAASTPPEGDPFDERSVAAFSPDAFVPSSPVLTRDEAYSSEYSTSSRTCATW